MDNLFDTLKTKVWCHSSQRKWLLIGRLCRGLQRTARTSLPSLDINTTSVMGTSTPCHLTRFLSRPDEGCDEHLLPRAIQQLSQSTTIPEPLEQGRGLNHVRACGASITRAVDTGTAISCAVNEVGVWQGTLSCVAVDPVAHLCSWLGMEHSVIGG